MDNRSLVLFLSGLAAAGTAVCIAVSCSDQPRPKCNAGRGPFTVVYAPVSGDTSGACAIPGEMIGVQAYNYPNSDRTNSDLNRGLMALKGGLIAAAIDSHGDPDTAHNPNSVGDFSTAEPAADDFCQVPSFSTQGEQDLPFIPEVPPMPIPDAGPDAFTEAIPAVPGQHIKYEWSNVKVLVRPTANGTQLAGDLKLSTTTVEDPDAGTPDACVATYRVRGLFNPNGITCDKDLGADAGGHVADFCACLPYADPDNGRATGSGLSPDLFGPPALGDSACEKSAANAQALQNASKVECHADLHLCVLKAEPPQ